MLVRVEGIQDGFTVALSLNSGSQASRRLLPLPPLRLYQNPLCPPCLGLDNVVLVFRLGVLLEILGVVVLLEALTHPVLAPDRMLALC